ncbi:hypothetical protein DE146DRAFT_618246 [Phaeosphaeria sp. MPI-PUGE-AT-0046c]|nr:hypothetical protein DE146DRAFT_618246 [Phaeosphaeria sp. MPI-PUGE-AT-0046c]
MPSLFSRRHSRKASKDNSSSRDKEKDKDKDKDKDESQPPPPQSRSERKEAKEARESAPKHQRTKTAPETPTLLRLPSQSSTATSSGAEPRSPPTRRPPASFSAGHDTSRGPPVTLLTRGNSDYARRTASTPQHVYAQQQQQQQQQLQVQRSQSTSTRRPRDDADGEGDSLSESTPQRQQQTIPPPSRPQHQRNSASVPTVHSARSSHSAPRPQQPKQLQHQNQLPPMASSIDESSSSESESESDSGSPQEEEQSEDLFLNIAEDVAPATQRHVDTARHDKLRSRIARVNRVSSPSSMPSSSTTPTTTRIPPSAPADHRSSLQPRRSSLLPTSSRTPQDRPPQSPGTPLESPRTRQPDLHSKTSFSRRDSDLSPRDFLAQLSNRRRGSQPDALQTPPSRTAYRPSNLGHYSSSRDDTRTPQLEPAPPEPSSHADGTESHGSTGPAASVWDELDELKTRIRRIEMGGKIPATSSAVISQATAERPRTANTSATTVSSSPNQPRKSNPSPSESTVDAHTTSRTHPLLREALVKVRQQTSPAVYRLLDATASEALTLAEMTGSAGPQGTLHSASSILGGANVSDRQVRRKADNICRSLTELCIAMCDAKPAIASPAVRSSTATLSRRPSVQINGDSPTIRQSIEPESNSVTNVSPSRAMHRIEARRTSLLYNGNGTPRESSHEPYDFDRQSSSRLSRAGTSLHRNHRSIDDDDDEPVMRAPSRAMTDFRSIRPTEKSRLTGRQYTSREPLPEFQSPPTLQSTASLRRPTVVGNENSLLFRDGSRRYDLHRESSPAYEKQVAGSMRARTQLAVNRNPNNRNSIGGVSDLSRNVTLGRRQRGNSTGE